MKLVCNIIGQLKIDDLFLDLNHMEMIDISMDEIRFSHRLREAIRKKELVPFDPFKHKNVRMVSKSESKNVNNTNDLSLKKLNDNLDFLNNKLDNLIENVMDKEKKGESALAKILSNQVSDKDNKLNLLIDKIEALISKPVSQTHIINKQVTNNEILKSDEPIFVPELDMSNIESKVMAKEEQTEGTDDILKELKKLKKGV